MITIKGDYWSLFRLKFIRHIFVHTTLWAALTLAVFRLVQFFFWRIISFWLNKTQLDFLLPQGDLEVIFFSFVFMSVGLSAGANFTMMTIPAIWGESHGIFFFSRCWLIHLWMTVLIYENLNYSERKVVKPIFNLWQFRVERYIWLSCCLTIIL